MAKRKKAPSWGGISFIVGLIIAILAGLIFGVTDIVTTILVILGLIVGLINISGDEATSFLVASIALIVAGSASLGSVPAIGNALVNILNAIVVFVAPAAIIVAIKLVVALARD